MTTTNYAACPTEIVEAPVGVVWKLLTIISGWGSFFDVRVTSVEPPGLPLGMTVHEALDCVPLEDGRCRVNYDCHFGFPGGWRGRLMRILLSRRLKEGPADSLLRLKRAAEQEHRQRGKEVTITI